MGPKDSAQVEAVVSSTLSAVHSKAVPFGVMQVQGSDCMEMIPPDYTRSVFQASCVLP